MRRIAWVLVVLVVLAAVVWFGQRRFIYFPETRSPGPAGDSLAGGSDVELRTADGLTLTAWRVDPSDSARDMAVLYLPGNGGHRGLRAPVARALAAEGFTVLLVDYRGYGGNPGRPSEGGLVLDAQAAQEYLARAGFPAERTIDVGESIGTGVAAHLAERVPPAGLVLRSPYTSLGAVARHTMGGLPIGWAIRDRFDTLGRMPAISAPVTVLIGGADETIPPAQSRAVADAATHLFAVHEHPGVGHNDALWFGSYLAQQVADLADLAE